MLISTYPPIQEKENVRTQFLYAFMFLYNDLMMTCTQGQNYLPDNNDRKGVLCVNENIDTLMFIGPCIIVTVEE